MEINPETLAVGYQGILRIQAQARLNGDQEILASCEKNLTKLRELDLEYAKQQRYRRDIAV